ncbi:MAG: mechanosensitive ion channel family protein [Saprospiraceae bacterium]
MDLQVEKELIEGLGYVGIFVATILITILLGTVVSRLFRRLIERSTEEMKNDPTNYVFLRHLIVFLIYIVGFSLAIYNVPELRGIANSLLAGAGILAVALGFASQHALSNIISGMFIVIFKPFRVNDRIHIQQMSGIIEDITLRHTVIRNFENRRIIIPNSVISNEILINADFHDEKICKWIDLSISYESNIDLARAIIQEEALAHPLLIDNRDDEEKANNEPIVAVRVLQLGESGIHLRAWCWAARQQDAFILGCDLYESIKKRFDAAGIEIPYPHRTLVYKNKPE